ncbi:olfactory receptor 11A1-like [Centroberyx affinis]|uniref:olfactory receptor 11A1-like n=1 Tax=Centroberyx affinis TaxID=166261 RepID=UPI003A5C1D3E
MPPFERADNSSQIVSFVLAAYGDLGNLRYLYSPIIIFSYLVIICVNVLLITTICIERSLHEPMYVFICSLFVNELYGSTAVFPCLISQMFSDTHEISFAYCFLQIFCLYTYANVEYWNLVAMAYDRYVSICHPLQYHVIMSSGRVCRIILLVWLCPFIQFTITYCLTVRLRFCGNFIDKVYCDLHLVNRLACSVSNVDDIYILVVGVVSITVPLIPISFSYLKIVAVCLRSSRETRLKAVRTCSPQVVSLVNLSFGFLFEIIQAGFPVTHVPAALHIILSVYLMVFQPLLNPVLYGLSLSKIRNMCVKLLLRRPKFLWKNLDKLDIAW